MPPAGLRRTLPAPAQGTSLLRIPFAAARHTDVTTTAGRPLLVGRPARFALSPNPKRNKEPLPSTRGAGVRRSRAAALSAGIAGHLENPICCRKAHRCYNDSRMAPAHGPSGALRTLSQSKTQQRTPALYSWGRGSTLTNGSSVSRHCRHCRPALRAGTCCEWREWRFAQIPPTAEWNP